MHFLHIHLLVNPHAGSGKGKKIKEQIENLLHLKKIPYTVYESDYAGHVPVLIHQLLEKNVLYPFRTSNKKSLFPLLVVLGGDGTLHEAINSFPEDKRDIPIAYIPCGSGNDFARGAGISRKPQRALEQILSTSQPTCHPIIHYIENNSGKTGFFVNNIGIGLDAAIVANASDSKHKQKLNKYNLGSFSYIQSIFSVLKQQKSFPTTIIFDQEKIYFPKTFLCTATNHPYFGGGVAIVPTASLTNEAIDLIIIEKPKLFKLLHFAILIIFKKHLQSKDIIHITSKQIRIQTKVPQFGQADGEVLGSHAFDFTFTVASQKFWF